VTTCVRFACLRIKLGDLSPGFRLSDAYNHSLRLAMAGIGWRSSAIDANVKVVAAKATLRLTK
jgi:hypothetical protein